MTLPHATRSTPLLPRRRTASIAAGLCALVALAVAVPACSSGGRKDQPRKRTVLLTEYDDAKVGREAYESAASQMGMMKDETLTPYVSEIGHKLLRGVPRRSFNYQFNIINDFSPNAFAFPGGYIFVSRGLLALVNDEDELANVIGHEITHAAKRHAAAQQALSQRGNPLSMGYRRQAKLAAYGRDMERDADRGGQMLAAAAGYDPMGMSTFLKNMGQMERLMIGYTRGSFFLDTHPGSQERAASNAARAREIRWKRDPSLGDTRLAHLRKIDGIVLGDDPAEGVFIGQRFLQPDMNFQLLFPQGWQVANSSTAVGASTPRGDAVVFLTADGPAGDPKAFADEFVEKTKNEYHLDVQKKQMVKVGHVDATRIHFEAPTAGGRIAGHMTFIPYDGTMFRITAAAPASKSKQYLGQTLTTVRSFRPLSAEERASIQVTRLALVKALPGEDLVALGERTGNAWDPGRTAVLNGIFTTTRFDGGELVKIARSEPYHSKTAAR